MTEVIVVGFIQSSIRRRISHEYFSPGHQYKNLMVAEFDGGGISVVLSWTWFPQKTVDISIEEKEGWKLGIWWRSLLDKLDCLRKFMDWISNYIGVIPNRWLLRGYWVSALFKKETWVILLESDLGGGRCGCDNSCWTRMTDPFSFYTSRLQQNLDVKV